MKLFKLYILVTFLTILSCKKTNPPFVNTLTVNGGVVLTFDDTFVDQWDSLDRYISNTYDWKATFFVARFYSFGAPATKKLLDLQNKGHEIGYHGTHHIDAVKYLSGHSIEEYADYELSDLSAMKDSGLNLTSFAYPYGSNNQSTDDYLLKIFSKLRCVDAGGEAPDKSNCYYNGSSIEYAVAIDEDTKYATINYITKLLQYARDNNKILILLAHNPLVKPDGTGHQVAYSTIQYICKYASENKMRMLRFKDL